MGLATVALGVTAAAGVAGTVMSATSGGGTSAALTQQNQIAQESLDEQKANDAATLAASQAELDAETKAWSDQLAVQTANYNETVSADAANLKVQQDAAAAQADAYTKQIAIQQQTLDEQKSNDAATIAAAQQSASIQSAQLQQQIDSANRLYEQNVESVNRSNQQQPDTSVINAQNVQRAKAGQSGTMLTGPTGVDTSSLLLGKTTLLGG